MQETRRADPLIWRRPLSRSAACGSRWAIAEAGNGAACAFPHPATGPRIRTRFAAGALVLLLVTNGTALAADVAQGAALYRQHCANCHGPNGRPVLPMAPDFTRPTALLEADLTLLATIRAGRGAMPAYRGQLRDREILDIVAHLRTLR